MQYSFHALKANISFRWVHLSSMVCFDFCKWIECAAYRGRKQTIRAEIYSRLHCNELLDKIRDKLFTESNPFIIWCSVIVGINEPH